MFSAEDEDFFFLVLGLFVVVLNTSLCQRPSREPKFSVPFKGARYIEDKMRSRHPTIFFETFRMTKISFTTLEGRIDALLYNRNVIRAS